MLTILSHDAGTLNYGYCVNRYNDKNFEVLEKGMIKHRISAVHEGLDDAVSGYLEEVDQIVKRHQVNHMCFERFQARSTGLYNVIECINLMIGSLLGEYRKSITFDGFYASNWKNGVNAKLKKIFDYKLDIGPPNYPKHLVVTKGQREKMSKEAYRVILDERAVINEARKILPSGYRNLFPGVPDHMVDAFFINLCGWYRKQGLVPFAGVDREWFELAGRAVSLQTSR